MATLYNTDVVLHTMLWSYQFCMQCCDQCEWWQPCTSKNHDRNLWPGGIAADPVALRGQQTDWWDRWTPCCADRVLPGSCADPACWTGQVMVTSGHPTGTSQPVQRIQVKTAPTLEPYTCMPVHMHKYEHKSNKRLLTPLLKIYNIYVGRIWN